MQSREDLKQAVREEVERRKADILEIGSTIQRNPELGFKEFNTAARVAQQFAGLGLSSREGLAITGVKAKAVCGSPGPTVALLGELDALIVPNHPLADPRTGAAHACGHNGQIASLLGAAMALVGSGVLKQLTGNVVFFAVPAEELVEIEYRMSLREQGKLEFLAGKQELIKLGEFDDVDMCMLVHGTPRQEEKLSGAKASNNGCIGKMMQYSGVAAHAGSSPHKAINALNAATIALHAIHTQRETFRDQDTVRVHPIITRGGDVVNIVPADVRMETFVRGRTLEAISDADAKVDRCLRAGALATGAGVKITTLPGYGPLTNSKGLLEIYKRNCLPLIGEDQWTEGGHATGSTDMGDMSMIMPALQPYIGGATGNSHGADYTIANPEVFYLVPAKTLAAAVVDLLYDGAEDARKLLAAEKPSKMNRDQYLAFQRKMARVEEYRG